MDELEIEVALPRWCARRSSATYCRHQGDRRGDGRQHGPEQWLDHPEVVVCLRHFGALHGPTARTVKPPASRAGLDMKTAGLGDSYRETWSWWPIFEHLNSRRTVPGQNLLNECGCFAPVRDLQLAEEVGDVDGDGLLGDEQPTGDRLVRCPGRQDVQDLAFPQREPVQGLAISTDPIVLGVGEGETGSAWPVVAPAPRRTGHPWRGRTATPRPVGPGRLLPLFRSSSANQSRGRNAIPAPKTAARSAAARRSSTSGSPARRSAWPRAMTRSRPYQL